MHNGSSVSHAGQRRAHKAVWREQHVVCLAGSARVAQAMHPATFPETDNLSWRKANSILAVSLQRLIADCWLRPHEFARACGHNFSIRKNCLAAKKGLTNYAAKIAANIRAHTMALKQAAFFQGAGGREVHQGEIGIVAGGDSAFVRQTKASRRPRGSHISDAGKWQSALMMASRDQ